MHSEKYAIKCTFMVEWPKIPRYKGNRGRGTWWWRQIFDRKWKYGRFAHAQWKIRNIMLIYGRIAEIYATLKEIGVREHDGDVRFLTRSGNTAISRMRSKKYAIMRSFMAEWPKIPRLKGNRGRETRRWRQILDQKWKSSPLVHGPL